MEKEASESMVGLDVVCPGVNLSLAVLKSFMQISFLNKNPEYLKIVLLDSIFIVDNANSISSDLTIERT